MNGEQFLGSYRIEQEISNSNGNSSEEWRKKSNFNAASAEYSFN
jgi:hypothetical protein